MESYHMRYNAQKRRIRHRRKMRLFILVIIFMLLFPVLCYCYLANNKIPPLPYATVIAPKIDTRSAELLPWSELGQAAIGSLEQGVIEQSTMQETAIPTASVAKIITALSVLNKHPIPTGGQGPAIKITGADVELYRYYVTVGGSNVAVEEGEILTEYQMIQAMLLPSANNIADSLAIWAFGSLDAYITYTNLLIKQWGLQKTNIADASGFVPQTVSTPSELIVIGQRALSNSIISTVVSQKQADIPIVGTIKNVNKLLGSDGIIGIKTGNTDEAGGCLLFAAVKNIAPGHTVTIIGAVQGSKNIIEAFDYAQKLLDAATPGFGAISSVKKGTKVGVVTTAWSPTVDLVAQYDITLYGWKAKQYKPLITIDKLPLPLMSGSNVGTYKVQLGNTVSMSPLVTTSTLQRPSAMWRLRHYF